MLLEAGVQGRPGKRKTLQHVVGGISIVPVFYFLEGFSKSFFSIISLRYFSSGSFLPQSRYFSWRAFL
jgi:hypothetical protein